MTAAAGHLVLVVGPSGAGKDAVISYARQRLGHGPVVFPRRVITRPPSDRFEDHIAASEDEFRRLAADGGFALHWRAHGLGYGVPITVVDDLAAGRNAVVNVSRATIDDARRRYPPVAVVSITAKAHILADRLRRRGREDDERIRARLHRAPRYAVDGADVVILDNSGPLERAGEMLVALLQRLPQAV